VTIRFDRANVVHVEFGVGLEEDLETIFAFVPVGADVQSAIREMVAATIEAMGEHDGQPARYDPADKHAAIEYLTIPLGDELARPLRELHESANLAVDVSAIDDPRALFCYFAKLRDSKGRALTAVRRATQFKGTVGKRLIRFLTNALRMIESDVFRLDNDFDLLMDSRAVHILRPSGFEALASARDAILEAAPSNASAIGGDMRFLNLENISDYAGRHPRAARLLASIRGSGNSRDISPSALKSLCRSNGVKYKTIRGEIVVDDGHELAFLEVLDRRRYELELVEGKSERYRAESRRAVKD
jgi:hypothetical protein